MVILKKTRHPARLLLKVEGKIHRDGELLQTNRQSSQKQPGECAAVMQRHHIPKQTPPKIREIHSRTSTVTALNRAQAADSIKLISHEL